MTYQEFRAKFNLTEIPGEKVMAVPVYGTKKMTKKQLDEVSEWMKANKPEILANIRAEKAAAMAAYEVKLETERNTVKVYLSSRGWGDYSPAEIYVDVRNVDEAGWLEAARKALSQPDTDLKLTDDDILAKVYEEIAKKEAKEGKKKAAITAENEKREKALEPVANIETTEEITEDEDGKVPMYSHKVTLKSGTVIRLSERNVFDYGVVINPEYSVVEGMKDGGLINTHDGVLWFDDYIENKGWERVRELTQDEIDAYTAIKVTGKYAKSGIRM